MSASTFLLVFLEGLLAFVSPCILPMLPVYLLYLSGRSAEDGAEAETGAPGVVKRSKKLTANTLFFVLGFTIVFLLLGMASTAIGRLLLSHRAVLEKAAGILIIFLGVHMTGLVRLPFLNKEHRLFPQLGNKGFFSSFLLGLAFSLGWSPCLGPFLGSALLLSSQSDTLWEGTALLLVFSLGISIPFLLTSILFEELNVVFSWFKKHMKIIKIISGALLIILGILMLTGLFGYYARLFT